MPDELVIVTISQPSSPGSPIFQFTHATLKIIVIRAIYSSNLVSDPYYVSYLTQFLVQLFTAVVTIWNLDFFQSFYGYICIHPDLN